MGSQWNIWEREPTKNGGWEDDFPFWLSNFLGSTFIFSGCKKSYDLVFQIWRSLLCQPSCRNLLAGHEASSWRHCGASDLNFSHPQNTDLKCNVGAWKMTLGRYLFSFKMLTFFSQLQNLKFIMEPENQQMEKEIPNLEDSSFSGAILNFRSLYPQKLTCQQKIHHWKMSFPFEHGDIPMSC